jgi:hypothetical protein
MRQFNLSAAYAERRSKQSSIRKRDAIGRGGAKKRLTDFGGITQMILGGLVSGGRSPDAISPPEEARRNPREVS